jgi:osmoprotectant transport system ATP-binding protein
MPSTRPFDRINEIEIRGISKKYGDNFAVRDLNLDITGGELLILIGGSGSGKTTTLRMINRLIEPDSGSIHINGINLADIDPVILRRNIGYVIQQIGLFPHMTVKENTGLIPRMEGWDESEIASKVTGLLDLVDLPPEMFLNRYPRQLSGGQQQRVGLARALAMDPPLLLMDEPFGALDPILRKQLQEEFLRIKEDIGRTIVFVTHDIDEAFRLGDRIAIMHDAGLIQVGEPEELILNPASDLVANLVDADRKFKRIDNLNVGDLMKPLAKQYCFDAGTEVRHALERMMAEDTGVAIVMERGAVAGIVNRRQVFAEQNGDGTLLDIVRSPLVFSPADAATDALRTLKEKKGTFALVMDGEQPRGLFFSDEVLLKLV